MKKNKKIDFDKIYSSFLEAWKDPRKKAGIKLGGYFIFFFILILVTFIMNNINSSKSYSDNKTTTSTVYVDKLVDKENDILTNKHSISYEISSDGVLYKINGYIENGVVSGYLESVDDIKKVVIRDNTIYEVSSDVESVLESSINSNFVSVSYIIDLIKSSSALIESVDGGKNYTYDISDIDSKIVLYTSDVSIEKISISNGDNSYLISFDN